MVVCIFCVIIFLVPHPSSVIQQKTIINVAIIRQQWDFIDTAPSAVISTMLHKRCLKSAEEQYNVTFQIFEFWDNWDDGDVQRGLLLLRNIDVVIAPGGAGGWYTPRDYRNQIKRYVRLGGGFYGICGDSTFGSLGVENLNWKYNRLLCRILDIPGLSPMLGLANVYTDASVIDYIVDNPWFFGRIDMIQFLFRLPTSRGIIHIKRSLHPIQEPYQGENIRIMLGNAPLIKGDFIRNFFMSHVYTIATYGKADKPYNDSINNKAAMICTHYGLGRVVLSPVHAEFTVENKKAQDIYIRNVLWLAGYL